MTDNTAVNYEEIQIYELIDPRDESIRYVGKSKNYIERQHRHIHNPTNRKMEYWLNELKAINQYPKIRLIECIPDEIADSQETKWIHKRIEEGCHLLNSSKIPTKLKNIKFNNSVIAGHINDMDQPLLKASDIAKILSVSRTQAYRLMREYIPSVRLGSGASAIRVRLCDLEEYINQCWEDHG